MKKFILELFSFLALFFGAYSFIFQEGSTTGGRALFFVSFFIVFCCYLLFIKQFKAAEILGQKEVIDRIELIENRFDEGDFYLLNKKIEQIKEHNEYLTEKVKEYKQQNENILNSKTIDSINLDEHRISKIEKEINFLQEQIKPIEKRCWFCENQEKQDFSDVQNVCSQCVQYSNFKQKNETKKD